LRWQKCRWDENPRLVTELGGRIQKYGILNGGETLKDRIMLLSFQESSLRDALWVFIYILSSIQNAISFIHVDLN
jgi:hypothetical protein